MKKQQWKSVNIEKPKKDGRYIGFEGFEVGMVFYDVKDNKWFLPSPFGKKNWVFNITHWMEVPKPPYKIKNSYTETLGK